MDNSRTIWTGPVLIVLLLQADCALTERQWDYSFSRQDGARVDGASQGQISGAETPLGETEAQASGVAIGSPRSIDEGGPNATRVSTLEANDTERNATPQQTTLNGDGLVDAGSIGSDSGTRENSLVDAAPIGPQFPRVDGSTPVCSGVVFEASCYQFFEENLIHVAATQICSALGGHLPIVETAGESSFLTELALPLGTGGTSGIWLGASRSASDGTLQWEDGTALTFDNFADNEPNSPLVAQCVVKNNTAGLWFDVSCDLERHFFCERPLD